MTTMTATPTATTLPATMTVRETSKLLGISLRATYRLIEADQLPVIRVGRRIYVITHTLYTMLGIPLDQPVVNHVDEDADDDVLAPARTSR